MIFVAGQQLETMQALPAQALSVLELIPDGESWLQWAIQHPNAGSYQLSSDEELLELINLGLHLTTMVRFHTFQADLELVYDIAPADLKVLTEAFGTDDDQPEQLSEALAKYNIVNFEQLATVPDWLASVGLGHQKCFKAMTLGDELALYNNIVQSPPGAAMKLQKEAAQFAAAVAFTATEFVNYFFFYLLSAKQLRSNLSASARGIEIQGYYNQLLPLCNFLIYTPSVGVYGNDAVLAPQLTTAVQTANFVGFNTKAAAMHNMALNFSLNNIDTQAFKDGVENFLMAIKGVIVQAELAPSTLSQDGSVRTFTIQQDSFRILLQIDTEGSISLGPGTTRTT